MSSIKLKDLSVKDIVGQTVMPRIDFKKKTDIERARRLVGNYNLSGFIIFNGEIEELRKTVAMLQSETKIPLLFGCDAERGLGQVVEGATKFPYLMSHGAANDPKLLEQQAEITAKEMKYCGLNLIFSPVLDVNTNPLNPIINIRSFSDDKEVVGKLGTVFIKKMKECGIISCVKHFPGHGSTDLDSHVDLPVLKKTPDELKDSDFVPFKQAIEQSVDCIMAGHLAVPKIDYETIPATISENIINGILRKMLRFDKVVITDSFIMNAVKKYGAENSIAERSIKAGCDIILDPESPEELLQHLGSEIENNVELQAQSRSACRRVLELKSAVNFETANAEIPDKLESRRIVSLISERSVCEVKPGVLGREAVIVNVFDSAGGLGNISSPFIDRLLESGIKVNKVNQIEEQSTISNDPFVTSINIVFTEIAAWKNSGFLSEDFKKVLSYISEMETKKILISFGSPYIAGEYRDFDIVLCSFDVLPPCQVAAADLLTGRIVSNAKMPVKF